MERPHLARSMRRCRHGWRWALCPRRANGAAPPSALWLSLPASCKRQLVSEVHARQIESFSRSAPNQFWHSRGWFSNLKAPPQLSLLIWPSSSLMQTDSSHSTQKSCIWQAVAEARSHECAKLVSERHAHVAATLRSRCGLAPAEARVWAVLLRLGVVQLRGSQLPGGRPGVDGLHRHGSLNCQRCLLLLQPSSLLHVDSKSSHCLLSPDPAHADKSCQAQVLLMQGL